MIPNLDGEAHLPECLGSLRAQTFRDFETIVVDNGSTDGSETIVRSYQEVRWLPLGTNTGFPAAANAGIAASTSEIVVLLNNDTAADPAWLERLVAALDATPEAGFAASKLIDHGDPSRIDAAGDGYWFRKAAAFALGAGEPSTRYTERAWVFGACAAAAAYRRTMLDDIGAFDEDFFFILEDVDVDMRAQAAGYRCVYAADAVVRHKRGASSNMETTAYRTRDLRNRIWVAAKGLPGPLYVAWWTVFAPRLAMILVRATRRRELGPFLDAVRTALRATPEKRRGARGLRRTGSRDLLRRLTLRHDRI